MGAAVGVKAFGFAVFVRGDTPRFSRMLWGPELAASERGRYWTLLRRAGVPAVSRSAPDRLHFTIGSNRDAAKGYVYSRTPLKPLRRTLDGPERAAGYGSEPASHRRLAPDWYLFLYSGD